jgi:hypothetical protein
MATIFESMGILDALDEPAVEEKRTGRTWFDAVNDTVVDTANAATGLVKAGVDLVSPDGSASEALDRFIKYGQETQSDKKKALRQQLGEKLKETGENDGTTSGRWSAELSKAGTYLKHAFIEDPLGTLGEIAGNIGPFALLGKGMQAANLSNGVRTAVASGVGAGLTAGEVRGNIWERISSTKDEELKAASPVYAALRESGMSEAEAKKDLGANFMRNLPEVGIAALIGAVGGKYGMEGMAAGVAPKMGRFASAAVSGIDEGLQGATEQVASNYGVQRVKPEQSLLEDLGVNTVAEALPGIAGGAAFGSHGGNHRVDPTPEQAAAPDGPLARAAGASNPAPATAVASAADLFTQRATEVEAAVRDGDLLDTLRASSPQAASGLVSALAVAKNTTMPQSARQRAVQEVDGILQALQMRGANEAGQAWQGLGVTSPQDDLAGQRARSEVINTAG